mmetsp:Transcript_16771/g.53041  ORF Transcript_16771/g.53041 Transcript_16771/m.53041 type:complete len:212 (+) Transcript_16771:431-1066(+)
MVAAVQLPHFDECHLAGLLRPEPWGVYELRGRLLLLHLHILCRHPRAPLHLRARAEGIPRRGRPHPEVPILLGQLAGAGPGGDDIGEVCIVVLAAPAPLARRRRDRGPPPPARAAPPAPDSQQQPLPRGRKLVVACYGRSPRGRSPGRHPPPFGRGSRPHAPNAPAALKAKQQPLLRDGDVFVAVACNRYPAPPRVSGRLGSAGSCRHRGL